MDLEDELLAIGRKIRLIRLYRGLKQSFVAQKIGICQTALSNIEAGRSHITLKNLFKLRVVLGCDMADFFGDIPGTNPATNLSQDNTYASLHRFIKEGSK